LGWEVNKALVMRQNCRKKLVKDVAMQPTDNITKKIEPLMPEHQRLRQTLDDTKQ
jgi:hypothetical protein